MNVSMLRFGSDVEKSLLSMWNLFCTLLEEHCNAATLPPHFVSTLKTGLASSNSSVLARSRKLWLSVDLGTTQVPKELSAVLESQKLPPYAPNTEGAI